MLRSCLDLTCWAAVSAYGAWFAWKELRPHALACLRQKRAMEAWMAGPGGPPAGAVAAYRRARLKATAWLATWAVITTAWSALLLLSSPPSP